MVGSKLSPGQLEIPFPEVPRGESEPGVKQPLFKLPDNDTPTVFVDLNAIKPPAVTSEYSPGSGHDDNKSIATITYSPENGQTKFEISIPPQVPDEKLKAFFRELLKKLQQKLKDHEGGQSKIILTFPELPRPGVALYYGKLLDNAAAIHNQTNTPEDKQQAEDNKNCNGPLHLNFQIEEVEAPYDPMLGETPTDTEKWTNLKVVITCAPQNAPEISN